MNPEPVKPEPANPEPVGSTEVERKFAVPYELPTPGPDALGPIGAVRIHHLRATYFDTAELTLLRHKITLRRRVGGDDDGWHVKLPRTGDARTELRFPLAEQPAQPGQAAPDGPPAAVRQAVAEVIGEAALYPVCDLVTERTESDLLAESTAESTDKSMAESVDSADEPHVLAVLCDDRVVATAVDPVDGFGSETAWREWEVELLAGTAADLDRYAAALLASGAAVADNASKLGKALQPLLDRR